MRRSRLRGHVGEVVSLETNSGSVEGVLDSLPRGHALVQTADGTRSAVDYVEIRSFSAPNTLGALLDMLGRGRELGYTGITVSPQSAISSTISVYACVSLRAEMIGSLPIHLYRRIDQTHREEIDPEGPYPGSLARLLSLAPNPEMTAQEFWELVSGHLDLWGNFYGNVERGPDGRPLYVWPLNPAQTTAMRDKETGKKFVRTYTPGGGRLDLFAEEVMHIRNTMTDGLNGISPIGVARQVIGGTQAMDQYSGRFFSNSAVPDGVLTVDKPLKAEDRRVLREQWQSSHGGLTNAHRVAILSGGVTWQNLGMSSRDAEFLQSRRFAVVEIARLYRIPPHMIQDVERTTSWGSGIEFQNIGFHTYTMRPAMTRIEAAVARDLAFPGSSPPKVLADEGLYAAFDPDHLLRADTLTRAQVNAIKRQWGIINANEWRAQDDQPPIEGDAGTHYLDPANFIMLPPGGPAPTKPPPPPPPSEASILSNGHG